LESTFGRTFTSKVAPVPGAHAKPGNVLRRYPAPEVCDISSPPPGQRRGHINKTLLWFSCVAPLH
jgi:hypothetical protein